MNVNSGQVFNFLPIPTDVHFGYGSSRSLPDHVRSLGGARAFLVSDPGVRRAGIVDAIVAILDQASIHCTIYDKVTADSGSSAASRSA